MVNADPGQRRYGPSVMINARIRSALTRCGAFGLVFVAFPAIAAPAETPEAFARRVYARYRTSDAPGVPTDRKGGAPYYTAALLDLFAKDEDILHDEVGAIDADPICACQDHGTVRVRSVDITPGQADTVEARVRFTNLQYNEAVTLTLAQTPAGWRIADVGSKDMKSVKAVLQDEIAHPTPPEPPGSPIAAPPKP